MKGAKDETDSAFGLPDSQKSAPRGQLDPEMVGRRSDTSLRVIVSCADPGLAGDYLEFLNDGSGQASAPRRAELLSAVTLLQRIQRQDVQPAEIVVFSDHRLTSQVLSLFAGLSQLASQVSFHCVVVLPSLLFHLRPERRDDMQELLDRLGESFRQAGDRLNSPPEAPGDGPESPHSGSSRSDVSFAVREAPGSRLIVIRTGYVLSPSSSMTGRLKNLRPVRALTGSQLSSTFVQGTTLFSAIDSELESLSAVRGRASGVQAVEVSATENAPSCRSGDRGTVATLSSHESSYEDASDSGLCSRFRNTRYLTILGCRRSWESVIGELTSEKCAADAKSLPAVLCRSLGIQWFIASAIRLLIRLVPSVGQVDFDTLKPRTVREIISLYNRHNCRNVQLAGYNNGVNHFGWKFRDRTVVLTTGLPGKTRLSGFSTLDLEARLRVSGRSGSPCAYGEGNSGSDDGSANSDTHFTVDAGLTLKHCIQELNRHNREFCVVPNYSWISMGTLFFVPVHGSGSEVSTLGDTIEDVMLYDGETEEFIFARRGDRLFQDAMYDTSRHRLLLRLTLRVKPKSVYSVRHETAEDPSAEDILNVFADPDASHVEIRKNRAAGTAVDIRRYYVDSPTTVGALEMPRDRIGRVWDRLEETPIASTLFHWFVRTFAFHVELFLKPEEFRLFWHHHKSLPISKIQLRQILKDGITHSACRHADCISVDLFMTRKNRDVFLGFISTHLPNVRFNPGKQSL